MEYVLTGASVFFIWGISAAVAGLIANDRKRNPWAFATITFFFLGPLGVGLAILAPHGDVERARLISARSMLAGVAKRKSARAAAVAAASEFAGTASGASEVSEAAAEAASEVVAEAAAEAGIEDPVVVAETVVVTETVVIESAGPASRVATEVVAEAAAIVAAGAAEPAGEAVEAAADVAPEPAVDAESTPAVEKPAPETKPELNAVACPKCKTRNAVPVDARRMRCRKCRTVSPVAA